MARPRFERVVVVLYPDRRHLVGRGEQVVRSRRAAVDHVPVPEPRGRERLQGRVHRRIGTLCVSSVLVALSLPLTELNAGTTLIRGSGEA